MAQAGMKATDYFRRASSSPIEQDLAEYSFAHKLLIISTLLLDVCKPLYPVIQLIQVQ